MTLEGKVAFITGGGRGLGSLSASLPSCPGSHAHVYRCFHPFDPGSSPGPYKIYNIGNSSPVKLLDFIDAIEKALGKSARKNFMHIQPGDVPATWADVQDLIQDFNYRPATPIEQGVKNFVEWYRWFYQA